MKKTQAKSTGAKPNTKTPPPPAKRQSTALATSKMNEEFNRDAGSGFENADRDSYALPFLTILQKMSPQCDQDTDQFIEGAKPGMFFNTATGKTYDGVNGVEIIPVHFQRQFVEWVPRDQGGGFKGSLDPTQVDLSKLNRNDSGKYVLPNGNELGDTRYHFALLLTEDGPEAVVISLTSSQIKKSRKWMTMMQNIKFERADGSKFTPPTYSHIYKMRSVNENNEHGTWKGYEFEVVKQLTDDQYDLYMMAKEFKKQVESGRAKVDPSLHDDSDGDDNQY